MLPRRSTVLALLLVAVSTPASGQATSPTGGSVPAAAASDVSSIDAIISALYHVISGPAGVKRDWDRFRSLHLPEARLITTGFPQYNKRTQLADFKRWVCFEKSEPE